MKFWKRLLGYEKPTDLQGVPLSRFALNDYGLAFPLAARQASEEERQQFLSEIPDSADKTLALEMEDWGFLQNLHPEVQKERDEALAELLKRQKERNDSNCDKPVRLTSSIDVFRREAEAQAAELGCTFREAMLADELERSIWMRERDECRHVINIEYYARHSRLPHFVHHHMMLCTNCMVRYYLACRLERFEVDPEKTASDVFVPSPTWRKDFQREIDEVMENMGVPLPDR